MNKFSYGNFNINNTDIAFASTSNYLKPNSELETRKQLSYPLKEIKDYINKTVSTNYLDNAVQLVVSATGKLQYRLEEGGALRDLTIGESTPYSFVGMVISGTNLTTEASVKAIYGNNTSWSIISSVIVKDSHVYGNGKALGLANGTDDTATFGVLRGRGDPTTTLDIGSDMGTSASSGTLNNVAVGVPTKAQLGSNPDNSGLVLDVETVYTWKRTA